MGEDARSRTPLDWHVVAEAGRRLAEAPQRSHLSGAELDRSDAGELSAEDSRALRLHVLRCTPCAELLAARRPSLIAAHVHPSDVILTCWLREWIPRMASALGERIGAHVAECEECAQRSVQLQAVMDAPKVAQLLAGLRLAVAEARRAHARRGRGFGSHRGGTTDTVDAFVLDADRHLIVDDDAPREFRFEVVDASLVGDHVHVELSPSHGVEPSRLRALRAELLLLHDGLRLELPPVAIEESGRIVVTGPVEALRGTAGIDLRGIPASSIGVVLLPAEQRTGQRTQRKPTSGPR